MSLICALPLIAGLFAACINTGEMISGYVEGEYVSLAPVVSARILEITVRRGARVMPGDVVARLDDADARIALDQAQARLAQTSAEAERARLDLGRTKELAGQNVAAQASLDAVKAALDVAEARMKEAQAALAAANWQLEQRTLRAGTAGAVDDVLRFAGDIAGPTAPVISLLPDGAVKLRLYAPEILMPRMNDLTELDISCDGCPEGLKATISYVAKEPEFTPPVIYSVDRRQKLIYMIEARPLSAQAHLRPGVIVDAWLKADP